MDPVLGRKSTTLIGVLLVRSVGGVLRWLNRITRGCITWRGILVVNRLVRLFAPRPVLVPIVHIEVTSKAR